MLHNMKAKKHNKTMVHLRRHPDSFSSMPFPLSPDDTLLLLLPLLLVLGLLLLLLVATEVGDSEEELPGEGLPSLLLPEVEGVDRTAS